MNVCGGFKCDACGNENSELIRYEVNRPLTSISAECKIIELVIKGLIKIAEVNYKDDIRICQSCVSKSFRSFRKDK